MMNWHLALAGGSLDTEGPRAVVAALPEPETLLVELAMRLAQRRRYGLKGSSADGP